MSDNSDVIQSVELSSTVGADEAIILLLGYELSCSDDPDCDPLDITLGLILDDILDRAETDYSNAKFNLSEFDKSQNTDEALRKTLSQAVLDKEAALHEAKKEVKQGQELYALLNHEVAKIHNGKSSIIVLDPHMTKRLGYDQITKISLHEWFHSLKGAGQKVSSDDTLPEDARWEDISIRIWNNNRLAYSYKNSKWQEKTLGDIDLLDKKTQSPSQQAIILFALSQDKKFPPGQTRENKHSKSMTMLGRSLRKLTGLKGSPFKPYNDHDGYKPRFQLKDSRRDADERAKNAAIHVDDYEPESKDYMDEDDDGAKWLDDNS
jgi:hypothetical protein